MKKTFLIALIGLAAIGAQAQLSTNTPTIPTSPDSFFTSAYGFFTSFNTNLAGCFASNSVSLWAGVDSIVGGGNNTLSMANEMGGNVKVYQGFGLDAIERNSGVEGTIVNLQGGLSYSYVYIDTQIQFYADAGYEFDQGKVLGEYGLRIAKALTTHTYAQIGYAIQNKSGPLASGAAKVPQVFSASVGFTF